MKAGAQQNNEGTEPVAYRLGLAVNLPIINSYRDTFSARTGWGMWGSAEYKLKDKIRISPGLAYNSLGFNQNYTTDSGTVNRRAVMEHYMELTGQFSFLTANTENSLRFTAGAGISLLAARTGKTLDIVGVNVTQRTIDNKRALAPGLLLSAGLQAPMSRHIDAGAQVTLGVPAHIYPRDVTGRMATVQFSVNYKFTQDEETSKETIKKEEKVQVPYDPDSICILVRLKENSTRIKLLKSQGYTADAQKEEAETMAENKAITEAFKNNFSFCPVLFFYDTDSKIALQGNFEGILLNDQLQRDSSVKLPPKEYFFAEFGRQFDEVSQTSGMYGLVIYTPFFKPVPSPFPSFVSNIYGFINNGEVIKRFEKRLKRYFAQ